MLQDAERRFRGVLSCEEMGHAGFLVPCQEPIVSMTHNCVLVSNILGQTCVFLSNGLATGRQAVRKSGQTSILSSSVCFCVSVITNLDRISVVTKQADTTTLMLSWLGPFHYSLSQISAPAALHWYSACCLENCSFTNDCMSVLELFHKCIYVARYISSLQLSGLKRSKKSRVRRSCADAHICILYSESQHIVIVRPLVSSFDAVQSLDSSLCYSRC